MLMSRGVHINFNPSIMSYISLDTDTETEFDQDSQLLAAQVSRMGEHRRMGSYSEMLILYKTCV